MKIAFASTLFLACLLFPGGAEAEKWSMVKSEKGVTVYEQKIGGKVAFRGVGRIEGNPAKLLGILENPKRWKHWIDNFQSGRLLERKSATVKVFYQAFDSPFPVSDRDMVYESVVSRNAKTGILSIDMKSVIHPKAPATVGVRVKLAYTRYRIEPAGKGMKVTLETLSDPGGVLPGFMVNWASRSYPVTLFEGLRREMKRTDQKEAPLPD